MTVKLMVLQCFGMLETACPTTQHHIHKAQLFIFTARHSPMLCSDHRLYLWPQRVPLREHSVSMLQIPTT